MKNIIITFSFIAYAIFGFGQTANITLTITDIKDAKGKMNIAMFKHAEAFPSGDDYVIGETIQIESANFTYVIKDLPFGTYAIAVSQDVNDNGEQDTNWIGIPKEPYGFSNNAKGKMGPPKFEDAKFDLTKDMNISIALRQL